MYKRTLGVVLIAISLFAVTGCGTPSKDPLAKLSNADLISLANTQAAKIADDGVKMTALQTLMKGIQSASSPTAAISTIDDGTGRLTFNSVAGKIVFPAPFEYPGSTQAPNTSSINITSTISIVPTDNWTTILKGTELDLQHSDGISGIIKAGYINNIYDRTKMQSEVMDKFFSGLPPETIVYSKLFLNDQWWGMEAKLPTTIDNAPAYLRAGMLGLGSQCFTYVFVYTGKPDAGKDETIVSLLKTLTMTGQQLKIQ